MPQSYLLPERPQISETLRENLSRDYERYATECLPSRIDRFVSERYGIDLRTVYAGLPIANPWGKASGQLSMNLQQVQEDVAAGLGFIVLKTVIAEDAAGSRSMKDWAIREARMLAEPITGTSGETGWTISWKGRGWWQSFAEYLEFVTSARRAAEPAGVLVAPSVKYHLPTPQETEWRVEEYQHTTQQLLQAWRRGASDIPGSARFPMPLEKDFSPTLAGSDRATAREKILEWLERVPLLIRKAAGFQAASASGLTAGLAGEWVDESAPESPVRVVMKMFNSLFDDDFQLETLRAIHGTEPTRPDAFVYANRLFDPAREFDGQQGIAYGGPDLSDRNLRILSRFLELVQAGEIVAPLECSATGNIVTGKLAMEYALRGASSFQLHTFFQLPRECYRKSTGSRTGKALHELYLHPETGFVAWMHHVAAKLGKITAPLRFLECIGQAAALKAAVTPN